MHNSLKTFSQKCALALTLGLVFLVIGYGLYLTYRVILLVAAGILASVFFDLLARPLTQHTRLPRKTAVLSVVLGLLAIASLGGVLMYPLISEQIQGLGEQLPKAWSQLRGQLEQYTLLKELLPDQSNPQALLKELSVFTRAQDLFSVLGDLFSAAVIIFFMGLYLALEPKIYKGGLYRLLPESSRERWSTFLKTTHEDLRGWLLGRLLSMALIALVIGTGLFLLEIPMGIFLGILAGLLGFIPYIGPLISAVPPLIFAAGESMHTLIWVGGLFLGAQLIESYILTPLIQKKAVSLPPALTLGVLAIFSTAAGLIGSALAAPLLVVALVAIRVFYLQDADEHDTEV